MKGNRAIVTAVVVVIILILGWYLLRRSSSSGAVDHSNVSKSDDWRVRANERLTILAWRHEICCQGYE